MKDSGGVGVIKREVKCNYAKSEKKKNKAINLILFNDAQIQFHEIGFAMTCLIKRCVS